MTKLREKAQAQVKQLVGQMIGDDRLLQEAKEQQQKADRKEDEQPSDEERARTVKRKASDTSQREARDPARQMSRTGK